MPWKESRILRLARSLSMNDEQVPRLLLEARMTVTAIVRTKSSLDGRQW